MNQGQTKEQPKNSKSQKRLFIKICCPLIPCLIPPRDDRENTERRATELLAYEKCCLLRLLPKEVISIPKKVVPIPKKVDSFPKTIDYFSKNIYSIPKKIYSLLHHLLLCFTPNKHKKCTFPQKKCIFLYILTSFSSLTHYLCSVFQKNQLTINPSVCIFTKKVVLLQTEIKRTEL